MTVPLSELRALGPFSTILADPPWPYGNRSAVIFARGKRNPHPELITAAAHYETMSVEEIAALPVVDLAADNAHLYMWITTPWLAMDPRALAVVSAWGFRAKTIITWAKVKADGVTPSMRMGWYYRSATEHLVFATRGALRTCGPARPTWFPALRLPHSAKPETAYRLVEEQSPPPRLELFARSRM